MSSTRQVISVFFDQSTSSRKVVVGTLLKDPDATQGIKLFYGTQALFQATIYTASPSVAYNPVSGCTWMFGIDDVPFSDNADYVLSDDDEFNIEGDWALLNEAGGLISFRVNMATTELKKRLVALQSRTTTPTMYGNLWMLTTVGNVMIASFPVTVCSVYIDPTTAVSVDNITHLTTEAAAAMYVPQWGDQARWKWSGTGWKYLFEDNNWREMIPTLVDGNPVIAWGNPEANT